jgi:type I restriction enzyme S subunit
MPNNWKTYKLGEFLEIKNGKTKPKEIGDIPIYGGNGILGFTNKSNVNKDVLIIGRVGAYCGSVYFEVNPVWISDNALYTFPKKDDNLKFIYYLLKQLDLNQFAGGSSQPLLTQDTLNRIEVTLPPLQEQKSIASILSTIDDKIENNLAINKTLEEMAMALYKHWFVDFGPFQDGEFVESELGRIPKGWEVLCLDDVSTLTAGGDKPKNFSNVITEECKIPIYSNGITNDGLYGFTDTARINEESITVSARGTIGFVCLRLEPYLPIVRLIAVVPNKKNVSSKYLFYWLKTQNINGNGTTQQQLTVPDFRVTKVMVPKLEFVNKFTDIINPYYDAINSNISENQTLTQLRDTLLPKLISGEVRLKEFRESITN